MDEKNVYLSSEKFHEGKYAAMAKKMSELSEGNRFALAYMNECGGVREDVFEYLSEHSLKSKEIFMAAKYLFQDNADIEWIKLVVRIAAKKNQKEAMYVEEIVSAYKENVDVIILGEYIDSCQNPHQLNSMRKKLKGSPKDNNFMEDLSGTLEGINVVLEQIELDSDNKKAYIEEIEKRWKEKEKELEKAQEKIDYYISENNVLKKKVSNLKSDLMHLKLENTKMQKTNNNNDFDLNVALSKYAKELFERIGCLEREVKEAKEIEIPEDFLKYISARFSDVEKKIENSKVAETVEKKEEMYMDDDVEEPIDFPTMPPTFEEEIPEDDNFEFLDNDEIKQYSLDDEEDLMMELEIDDDLDEEVEVKEEIKTDVQVTKVTEEETEKKIYFFQRFKEVFENKKFRKLDEKSQKQHIIKRMMEKKFAADKIKCVKNIMDTQNASNEFIFSLIEKDATLSEFEKLLFYSRDSALVGAGS